MKFIVVPHPGKKSAIDYAEKVFAYINKCGSEVVETGPEADVAILLGGDGFIMDQLEVFSLLGVPCFGINAGDLGFLAIGTKRKWKSYIQKIIAGKHIIERRIMLCVEHEGKVYGPYCGDVFFIDPGSVCRFVSYVNGFKVFQISAGGVIVSTPLGSTAYSGSENGPIVEADVDAFILTPISAQNYSLRPVVVSPKKEIRIDLISSKSHGYEDIFLRGSGKRFAKFVPGESIKISKHETEALFITFDDYDFFHVLREKKNFATE